MSYVLFLNLQASNLSKQSQTTKRTFQLYGCIVTSKDMVSHKDPTRQFDKVMNISGTR
jgi:alpha-aminoadipic semialdehyde synthase